MDTQEIILTLARNVASAPDGTMTDAATVVNSLTADKAAHGIGHDGTAITALVIGDHTVVGYGETVEVFECDAPDTAVKVWARGIDTSTRLGLVVWDMTP